MELLAVDSLKEAREKLVKAVGDKPYKTKKIHVNEALGYVLAADIKSSYMIPDFRRSTVDGYAVLAKDTWGASESAPVFLEIIGEVNIGFPAEQKLHSGECVYVPTGGMLPDGAECMVMIEYCEIFDQNHIAVYESAAVGKNMVEIGEDIKEGEILLKKNTRIAPRDIAALAAAGIIEICVFEPLAITILSTGDELIPPGEKRNQGQIYDINTYGLQALAVKHGLTVRDAYVVKDEESLLLNGVTKAMETSDIVLVSGGSSQGKKDMTKKILNEAAAPGVFTHGLSLKPGKPTILGYDEKSETLLAGLPGHPVAAMLVFELLILWLDRYRLGTEEEYTLPAVMETNIASSPGKTTCQMVELIKNKEGYTARPVFGKSGLITTLSWADGYVLINMNKEGIRSGERVEVHLL